MVGLDFGDEVLVSYDGFVMESGFQFADDVESTFRIGDEDVIAALELVGRRLKVGERRSVCCVSRFGYGEIGVVDKIPGNATLRLEVELKAILGKKLEEEKSAMETMQEATKKKQYGNEFFKNGNYEMAVKKYEQGIQLIMQWRPKDGDLAKIPSFELLVSLGNNNANAYLKLEEWTKAGMHAMEVLKMDKQNVKAMYRFSVAAYHKDECVAAMDALKVAASLDKKNREVRNLMITVQNRMQEIKAKEKELYSNFGGKPLSDEDPLADFKYSDARADDVPDIELEDINEELFNTPSSARPKFKIMHMDWIALSIAVIIVGVLVKILRQM